MNISRENEGNLTAYIKIDLTPEDYREQVSKELKQQQKKAQLKGFRPGQVPFGLIQKMYGKPVLVDVVNQIISDSLMKHIEENKLEVLGQPIPAENKENQVDFDNPNDFSFWFEIGLAPEFNVNLEKINVKNYQIEISDEMVEKYIDNVTRRAGEVSHPEVVSETDLLGGEITELNAEGLPLEGGIKVKTSISVDLISLKTIQKKFIGAKVGDEISFTIAKAFKNTTDLAAMLQIPVEKVQDISPEFSFKIESITNVIKAELNEDLYKKIYPQATIKTEAEFREQIRKESAQYYVKETDKKLANDVIDEIIKQTNIELPKEFLKRWLIHANQEQNFTKEMIDADFDKYEKSLQWQLIENKLSKEFDLNVNIEEVRTFYKENVLSQYFPITEDEESIKRMNMFVDSMLQNKEEAKRVYDMLFEQKLTDLFKGKVKAKDTSISFDGFVELIKKEKN